MSRRMSVLIETSLGEIVVDLYTDKCPITSKNFIELCKFKYYNNNIFYSVEQDFIVRSGDPTATGTGGESAFSLINKQSPNHPDASSSRYFTPEIVNDIKHNKIGLLCMDNSQANGSGSRFYITLRNNLSYLDNQHTIFGEISSSELDSFKTLLQINNAFCDKHHRPYQNIRILHTHILEDPFSSTNTTIVYPDSPREIDDNLDEGRLRADECWSDEFEGLSPEEIEKILRKRELERRSQVLVMLGDLPDADAAPPENVAFVCQLNPVTEAEDLEILFGNYGRVTKCVIIKEQVDPKLHPNSKTTQNNEARSLGYGFVTMATAADCHRVVKVLNGCVIDDRRIKVDYSQSVAHLMKQKKRGDVTFDDLQRQKEKEKITDSFNKTTGTGTNKSGSVKSGMTGGSFNKAMQGISFDSDSDDDNVSSAIGNNKQDKIVHNHNIKNNDLNNREKDREREREKDRDRERERERDKERDRYRDKDRNEDRDRYRDKDRDRYRDKDRDRYRDRNKEDRDRDRYRDRSLDRDRNNDRDRHRDSNKYRDMDRERSYSSRDNYYSSRNSRR